MPGSRNRIDRDNTQSPRKKYSKRVKCISIIEARKEDDNSHQGRRVRLALHEEGLCRRLR